MDKDPFLRSVVKTDPCLYFFEYSPDVLKKKKVIDIFNTDKKCYRKNYIQSSPLEIWIRIPITECEYNFSFCLQ